MTPGLKVYGWRGIVPLPLRGTIASREARLIVAARSRSDAAQLAGLPARFAARYVSETRNAHELRVALASPGRVLAADPYTRGSEPTFHLADPCQPPDDRLVS